MHCKKDEGAGREEEKTLLSALAKYRNQSLITRPLRRWGIWGRGVVSGIRERQREGEGRLRLLRRCQRRENCLEVRALSVRAFE